MDVLCGETTPAAFTAGVVKILLKYFGKKMANVNPYINAIAFSTYFISHILKQMKKAGTEGFANTYKYEFLYGDPTTVPRWTAIDVDYDVY